MSHPFRRILAGLAVTTTAAISACSGGGGGGTVITPPPPGNASYHWMNPISEGYTLTDVWGASADNLFATGTGGIVMRYDGQKWRLTHTPVTANLNAIWGTDASHIFAVGADGVILFYNGSSWTQMNSNTDKTLNDVWGMWDMDVYAVGQQREIMHYTGAVWDTMAVANGDDILYSIWGSSAHDIYVTGVGNKLLHYGIAWNEIQTNATFTLNAVWGTGATDVFAVGGNGAAVHWDGLAWNNIDIGESLFPNTVWGTNTNDVYAMGVASGAGHNAFHWDGGSWAPVETHTVDGVRRVFGVDNEVIAVGQVGMILRKSGAEFVSDPGGDIADLEAVWVSSDGSRAFAVGDGGTILNFENGKWSPIASGTTQNLRGLGGVTASSVLACGENGTVLKYNGSSWSDFSPGLPVHFNEVWVDPTTGDAFLAGEGGTVMKLENGIWSPLSLGSVTKNLLSVWGSSTSNVYVVGNDNTAFKWTGTQFKVVSIATAPNVYNFHSVYGTASNDIYVGAELQGIVPPPSPSGESLHAGGAIFHSDGGITWTPVYTDPISDVLSVWRANDHEGYATGDFASLVRNASSDNGWVRVLDIDNLPQRINSVWGSSMKNVFIVGDDGAIVRYSP